MRTSTRIRWAGLTGRERSGTGAGSFVLPARPDLRPADVGADPRGPPPPATARSPSTSRDTEGRLPWPRPDWRLSSTPSTAQSSTRASRARSSSGTRSAARSRASTPRPTGQPRSSASRRRSRSSRSPANWHPGATMTGTGFAAPGRIPGELADGPRARAAARAPTGRGARVAGRRPQLPVGASATTSRTCTIPRASQRFSPGLRQRSERRQWTTNAYSRTALSGVRIRSV